MRRCFYNASPPSPAFLYVSVSAGFFPPKHPEKHGVHVSPGQELHYQQGDAEPLSVLPPTEVLCSWNVQRV